MDVRSPRFFDSGWLGNASPTCKGVGNSPGTPFGWQLRPPVTSLELIIYKRETDLESGNLIGYSPDSQIHVISTRPRPETRTNTYGYVIENKDSPKKI